MKKALRKKILIGAGIALVLIIVGLGALILSLGAITRMGITKGGSAVLGVPVKLQNADVSLMGSVGLDGLGIGSPEGYEAENMFFLGHGNVDVKVLSLLGDEIVVREVVIDGPEITFELSGGKANWSVLLNHLKKKSKSEPEERPEEEAGEMPQKGGKKMRIDHIVFKNGKIHIAGIPFVEQTTVPLPRVEMKDVGAQNGEGKSIPDTMFEVVTGLYEGILKALDDVLPSDKMKKITEDVGGMIGDAAGQVGKTGKEIGGEAGKTIKDTVGDTTDKARDTLGGLFGGDEEEEEK